MLSRRAISAHASIVRVLTCTMACALVRIAEKVASQNSWMRPAATPREQFPHAAGIPGLFLAGQTTYPGYGVGAAMMSGIFAAEALLAAA
jgi:hypothetical protein